MDIFGGIIIFDINQSLFESIWNYSCTLGAIGGEISFDISFDLTYATAAAAVNMALSENPIII